MNIIDDIKYNGRKHYDPDDISQAYKELFKEDSLIARIVMQDLLVKSNYFNTGICSDSNIFYHESGMRKVIDILRDGIMTPRIDKSQQPSNVDEINK